MSSVFGRWMRDRSVRLEVSFGKPMVVGIEAVDVESVGEAAAAVVSTPL